MINIAICGADNLGPDQLRTLSRSSVFAHKAVIDSRHGALAPWHSEASDENQEGISALMPSAQHGPTDTILHEVRKAVLGRSSDLLSGYQWLKVLKVASRLESEPKNKPLVPHGSSSRLSNSAGSIPSMFSDLTERHEFL
jgi:hypothetical protein